MHLRRRDRQRFDLREQPRLGVHGANEVVHRFESLGALMDDEVETLIDHVQIGIGDEYGHLDDRMTIWIKARHLEVNPNEAIVGSERLFWHADTLVVRCISIRQ